MFLSFNPLTEVDHCIYINYLPWSVGFLQQKHVLFQPLRCHKVLLAQEEQEGSCDMSVIMNIFHKKKKLTLKLIFDCIMNENRRMHSFP